MDRVFHALSDATRRDMLSRVLAGDPVSISALASRYDMSFTAARKHVGVLESAGLVSKQVVGRERRVRGRLERIECARAVLGALEQQWKSRFDQVDGLFIPQSKE